MTPAETAARVLVTSDSAEDAQRIVGLLKSHFPETRSSTDADKAAATFESFEPAVLVVAVDSFQKARDHVLRLYRSIDGHPVHSSLLLCNKDDVREAFEACRDGMFDDYAVHWPPVQDPFRLPMSVLNAVRRATTTQAADPARFDLVAHARRLDAMQALLQRHLRDEEPPVNPADGAAAAAAPWARRLREKLLPHMAALGAFGEEVRRVRPLVLFVEDDQFARKVTQKALEDKDYELVFAADGMSALNLLRTARPDLIMMDVNLPDIDGVALTRKLKAMPHLADTPVVMLTSEANKQTLESSVAAGAAGFVVKPFTRDALAAKMDKLLGR